MSGELVGTSVREAARMLAIHKTFHIDGIDTAIVDYTVPTAPLLGEFRMDIGYGPEHSVGALELRPGMRFTITCEVVELEDAEVDVFTGPTPREPDDG